MFFVSKSSVNWQYFISMKGAIAKLSSLLLFLPILVSCSNSNLAIKKTTPTVKYPCQNCLLLIRDRQNRTNSLGNPIYKLEAYQNSQKIYSFDAVTGRKNTQNKNRNRSGTQAPLPDGKYLISSKIVPGLLPETGETFIPIYPEFATGRTDLGIHYDPSFNKNNGEDGTAGCIALTNKSERDLINQFVIKYNPKELIVNIQ